MFRSAEMELHGEGPLLRSPIPAPWADHFAATVATMGAVGVPDAPPLVALAALAFDRQAAGELIVPQRLWVRPRRGRRYVQVVDAELADDSPATPAPLANPTTISVTADIAPSQWQDQVARIVERIRRGELDKAVLFRSMTATSDQPFVPARIARILANAVPSGYAYLIDGFVGVSPELLVARQGDIVRAHPMAGTLPRTGNPDVDTASAARLMADPKMQAEHAITIERLHHALLGFCSYLDAEPHPSVVAAAGVQHLATLVEGRLSRPAASVAELVAAVHPTPAVGGWPLDAALAAISEIETCVRGRAGGPVGWVNASGDGEFAVGIRCADIDGTTAHLLAGVGVVADSVPAEEFKETEAKFTTVLPAVVRL